MVNEAIITAAAATPSAIPLYGASEHERSGAGLEILFDVIIRRRSTRKAVAQ